VRSQPNRRAVIDIGTNTVNLLVCDVDRDARAYEVIEDVAEVTRLAQGLEPDGHMHSSAIARTSATIRRYLARAKKLGATETVGVGTSVLRDAANTAAFLELVRNGFGLDVSVIPSAAEARLSYLSVRLDGEFAGGASDRLVVTDVGSGSTEFVFGRFTPARRELDTCLSVSVGAVHLTPRFLRSDPPTDDEVSALSEWLDETLASQVATPPSDDPPTLVGVGGTIVNLAAVKQGKSRREQGNLHGTSLTVEDIDCQISQYQACDTMARARIPGLESRRADTIIAGAAVVRAILSHVGAPAIQVSARGLRYGVMYDRFVAPEDDEAGPPT